MAVVWVRGLAVETKTFYGLNIYFKGKLRIVVNNRRLHWSSHNNTTFLHFSKNSQRHAIPILKLHFK